MNRFGGKDNFNFLIIVQFIRKTLKAYIVDHEIHLKITDLDYPSYFKMENQIVASDCYLSPRYTMYFHNCLPLLILILNTLYLTYSPIKLLLPNPRKYQLLSNFSRSPPDINIYKNISSYSCFFFICLENTSHHSL